MDDAEIGRLVRRVVIFGVLGLALAVGGCLWGYPSYQVYSSHMRGRAKLAEAQYAKQVLVQDALARLESSRSLAAAEVERAKGVAEANRIIGDSLQGNEAYLHYLWLHGLETGGNDVIYIPTEAGMPIFEAGGRFQRTRRARLQSGEPGTAEHPDAPSEHPQRPGP